MQISKGYDRYLDERGRGKAKKLTNIAIYRLFDRICVNFSMLVDIMTNNTQYTSDPLAGFKLALVVHLLNHQYHYPKISTEFATKK